LSRLNSTTPAYPDTLWGLFGDIGVYGGAVGSNSNPLAGASNNGYDDDFLPRGAFVLDFIQIDRYVNGVFADNSPVCVAQATNSWVISIRVKVVEPFLALSPYVNTEPDNCAGLVGVNNLSLVCNVDATCSRMFSSASGLALNGGGNGLIGYISAINLGWPTAPNGGQALGVGFQNTRLLFNFLSLQPEQYAKISTKNVVPFVDYPRYLTTFSSGTTIASLATTTLTSQSIQLNQIPDLILITARYPMNSQNQFYANSFLAINNISINFNNASGLLSTATQQDLYNISFRNGSAQSFTEFRGFANNTGVPATPTAIQTVPTSGSLLVLNPVMDFSLPSYLSSSSLGQYQFQFNLTVTNQFPYAIQQPEICIITMNSGIFVTQQGTSQIYTGILTKEQVLSTKEKNPVPHLASNEYKRLVGGKLSNRGMGSLMKMVREMPRLHHQLHAQAEGSGSGGSSGGSSGGMAGGAISGKGKGSKSLSKLAKHFA
jgi:hypothetical protein